MTMLLVYLVLSTACGVKKKLGAEDYLVEKNDIVLLDKKGKAVKVADLEYALSTLAKPKPNSKTASLFRTGVWAYYKTLEADKDKSESRFLKKRVAEPPSLYSDSLANLSAKAMTNYLHKKGFFQAKVVPDETIFPKRKIAKVKYLVTLGNRYVIDSISYKSLDPQLQPVIDELAANSLFKKSKSVTEALYGAEVQRITDSLRNRGYAYFFGNYIQPLRTDSTEATQRLDLEMRISQPADSPHHEVYRIGKLTVYPNYQGQVTSFKDSLIGGVHFAYTDAQDFNISPQVLLKQLQFKEGDLYRQKAYDKTNELLGNLGLYKFINITPIKDDTQTNVLNIEILLTPSKRHSMGVETELNNSFRSLSTSGRIFSLGGGVNWNYQNRNAFGGGELLNMLLEGGVEVNFSDDRVGINTLDVLARTDVYFPKFIDYLGYWRLMHGIRLRKKKTLLTDNFYKDLVQKARSRVSLSYNYQDFINFYTFNTFNVSLGYNLTRTANERIVFNQTGVDLFISTIRDSFQVRIDENPFLERSLGDDQLFTGFLYRNINYTWTTKPQKRGGLWQFRLSHDLSGAEVLLLNSLVNKQREAFKLNKTTFAHYTRLDADVRYLRNYANNSAFAARIYSGVAVPFGRLTSDVPYVKQFFIGGPSSVRAWLIRQLGPGTFYDAEVTEPPYYQAADVKLEMNAEYRFDLLSYFLLEGALFLDAGNIWTLQEDPERPGSQLDWRFWDALAIGGGVGFRVDFSFFIIRLDMGYKLRTPYLDENGNRWQFYRFGTYNFLDYFRPSNATYNLAIGYPF